MGAAMVMAMFASQELGPMRVPVTVKDLVGRWKIVDRDHTGKIRSTAIMDYKSDGTVVSTFTPTGGRNTLVFTGRVTITKNIMHHEYSSADNTPNQNRCIASWTSTGNIYCTDDDGDSKLMQRVRGF